MRRSTSTSSSFSTSTSFSLSPSTSLSISSLWPCSGGTKPAKRANCIRPEAREPSERIGGKRGRKTQVSSKKLFYRIWNFNQIPGTRTSRPPSPPWAHPPPWQQTLAPCSLRMCTQAPAFTAPGLIFHITPSVPVHALSIACPCRGGL